MRSQRTALRRSMAESEHFVGIAVGIEQVLEGRAHSVVSLRVGNVAVLIVEADEQQHGEAHRLGLPVAAHVESPEGVRVALENGVDTIEHGAKPDEEILRLFRERGAAQVATLSAAVPYARFDRSVSKATEMEQYNGEVVLEGIIECAKACLAAGIPVGLGTDTGCPYITHYDMWRELNHFVKYCGVTPAFALYSATKLNARLAGIGDVTGGVEIGKQADLIVCTDDPLKSPSALRTLDMVVKGGYRINKPQVKKMPEVERELDNFL